MEYNNRSLHLLGLFVLLCSTTFQIVSLSAPGWDNSNYDGIETYTGIFYITTCLRTCHTSTKHDSYHRYWDYLHGSEHGNAADIIRLDRDYHKQVAEQVYMILTFASTLLCLALQFHKLRHNDASFRSAAGVASICLSFASGLMIITLTSYFIVIERGLRLSKDDDYYITFPFCVFLYSLAFMANIVTVILYITEVFRREDSEPTHEAQTSLHQLRSIPTTERKPYSSTHL